MLVTEALARLVHHHIGGELHPHVVDHLGVVEGLDVAAGPGAHAVAVAGATHDERREVQRVGAVVGDHLLVALVVARGQNHALAGVELGVGALGARDDAGHGAGLVAHELHAGHLVEHIDAVGCGVVGQQLRGGGMGAHGAGHQEVRLIAVAVAGVAAVLLGRHLGAGLGEEVTVPLDDLAAALGPGLKKRALGAQVVEEHEVAHKALAGGVVGVAVQAHGGEALGGCHGKLLKQGDLGAQLGGVHGGGHAGLARAHDDDLVILRLGDVDDGLRGLEEGRRVVCRLPCLGRLVGEGERAARKGARREGGTGSDGVTTGDGSAHGEAHLFSSLACGNPFVGSRGRPVSAPARAAAVPKTSPKMPQHAIGLGPTDGLSL